MEVELILIFVNKHVKLEYFNGFIIRGAVLRVYKDSILFLSDQKSKSAINLKDIKSVCEVNY